VKEGYNYLRNFIEKNTKPNSMNFFLQKDKKSNSKNGLRDRIKNPDKSAT